MEYKTELKYLTPKEVEQVYPLNAKTLANWRSQSRGPGYLKIGGKIYYQAHEIKRFILKCRVKTDVIRSTYNFF